jgi:hypothetical protein
MSGLSQVVISPPATSRAASRSSLMRICWSMSNRSSVGSSLIALPFELSLSTPSGIYLGWHDFGRSNYDLPWQFVQIVPASKNFQGIVNFPGL